MSQKARLLKPAVLAVLISALVGPAAMAANEKENAVANDAHRLVAAHLSALQGTSLDSFTVRDTIADPDGTQHIRLDRTYRGLPVIGGDVVLKTRNGKLRSTSMTLRTTQRPSIQPRLSRQDAAVEAGTRFAGTVRKIHSNNLVVYARGPKPVLAYEVILQGDETGRHSGFMQYYVDATSGNVLDVQDLIQTAAAVGLGKSYYYGDLSIQTDQKSATKYDLIDTTRGNGSVFDAKGATVSNAVDIMLTSFTATQMSDTDNVWGNNSTSDVGTLAVDIHYGVGQTWDYYKNVHGRNGLKGDGRGIRSHAHTTFRTKSGEVTGANAAYAPLVNAMFYGDGDASRGYGPIVSIDVAGHEMTHGVNSATANLTYSGDAGGLNEGTSDIFGTMVEYYANNANDPGDYLIGDKIRLNGTPLRVMYNQAVDGKSFNCYPVGGFDSGQAAGGAHDPHYTSGVTNRFFYLASEGAVAPAGSGLTPGQLVCNGDTTITGIGRDKVAKIWYRALTTKFTSSTTYPQARIATLEAATELFGSGSAEYNAVARAWSAVSVN